VIVFVQPRPPHAPTFLGDFIPDAIAIGHGKNIVIEVKRSGSLGDPQLQELAAKFKNQSEWELKIILISPTASPSILPLQSSQAIQGTIGEITQLRDTNAIRSAFLLAWATLEAEARRLMPNQFGRPQTPGRIVQILGQEGYLTPDETDRVRALADIRNRLMHGDLSVGISRDDLDQILSLLSQLAQQEPAEQAESSNI
jgi:uncharacterized protein YutE (UPF0331/DUF86 family)